PIAVWFILHESFPLLGVVLSVTLLVTMAVRGGMRMTRYTPSPLLASAIRASAWVLRIFAMNGAAIILIDSYTGAAGEKRGMGRFAKEQAADEHTGVDE